jgi:hypothetical protein
MGKEWPRIARMGWTLFLLHALIWVLLGVVSVARMAGQGSATSVVVVAVLMFVYAAVALWLAWGMWKRRPLLYYLALAALVVNAIMSLTDQVGLWDVLVLFVDVVTLVLLLAARGWFTRKV